MSVAGAALVVLAGLSAPAMARCVIPSDLARGIVFLREGTGMGTAMLREGAVELRYTAGNAEVELTYLADRGVFPRRVVEAYGPGAPVQPGERDEEIWRFASPPPPLVPGVQWTASVAIQSQGTLFGQHDTREQGIATYAVGGPETVEIGGCRYSVLSVEGRIERGGATRQERFAYFPDLGFGLLTGVTDRGTGQGVQFGLLSLAPMERDMEEEELR